MSELLALSSRELEADAITAVTAAADLDRRYKLEQTSVDEWLLAATCRSDAPLPGARLFEDSRYAAVFAGDLVGFGTVPMQRILDVLGSGRWEDFGGLEGNFAVAVYDRTSETLFAVSDRRSQKPLFYGAGTHGLYVASNLAVFARLGAHSQFDRTWLWQALFFNFSVDGTTFLRDVRRMPPASVLAYHAPSGTLTVSEYAPRFRRRDPLLEGREALDYATEVFARRVPPYFNGSGPLACAVTDGWDARTMLALAPASSDITGYTYGIPGCDDLAGGAEIARAAGVPHVPIPFDDRFLDRLPYHAFETVYLSGGMQGVLRSTLHAVYDVLTAGGERYPLTVSGISLDSQFRGHINRPARVSHEMATLFGGADAEAVVDQWRERLGPDHAAFADTIGHGLEVVEAQFGPLADAEHHLSYAIYPASASYFAGELAIAEHFTTVRVPCWDSQLIALAYSIDRSTLHYSQYLSGHQRGSRDEMVLQSWLLKAVAPWLYRVPVHGSHPAAVLGGELPYRLECFYRSCLRRAQYRSMTRRAPRLEAWEAWLFDRHRQFVLDLLCSRETSITDYLPLSYVDHAVTARDTHAVGKLLTIEIILRLINSRWQRFW